MKDQGNGGRGSGIPDMVVDWMLGPDANQQADRARLAALRRRQLRKAWPWLLWLLAVMAVGMLAIPANAPLWLRMLVAALLIPPMVVVGRLRLQLIAQLDEMQQRIEYQAMGFTFVLTLCTLLGVALLREMHVPVHVPPILAFWMFFGLYLAVGKYLRFRLR